MVTIGVQVAYVGAVYQATRRGDGAALAGTPGARWLTHTPAPWLRAVCMVPDRRPVHARRLFPSGGTPGAVERMIADADGPPHALYASFLAALDDVRPGV
jgi:hypothetical protein